MTPRSDQPTGTGRVFRAELIACGFLMLLGCSSPAQRSTLLTEAKGPVAIVVVPGGGLRYGERATGRIREIARRPGHSSKARDVAHVSVSTRGQRGLLGLAVQSGKTFAAWTTPEGRLVVGQVAPGPVRLIWLGPQSSNLANGGHLVVTPSGQLVIGIGDLEHRSRVQDPRFPNGKILRLDPNGPATQQPVTLSSGWNNPFAFTFTPRGELWVADNSPGAEPERLARGDIGRGPSQVTVLGRHTVPAGLAALRDGSLVLCHYTTGKLIRYRVDGAGRARPDGSSLADDCSGAIAVLVDGDLAYGTKDGIRLLHPT